RSDANGLWDEPHGLMRSILSVAFVPTVCCRGLRMNCTRYQPAVLNWMSPVPILVTSSEPTSWPDAGIVTIRPKMLLENWAVPAQAPCETARPTPAGPTGPSGPTGP